MHLEGADLRAAHLGGALLREAHLEGTDLRGAHLEGAHLEGANLAGTHLEGAYGLNAGQLSPEQLQQAADLPQDLARLVPEAPGASQTVPSQPALEAADGQPAD